MCSPIHKYPPIILILMHRKGQRTEHTVTYSTGPQVVTEQTDGDC